MSVDIKTLVAEQLAIEPPPADAGIFGVSVSPEDANLVLIPVPWDATASYGKGAAAGPRALVPASHQLDLFDLDFGKPVMCGIAMETIPANFPYITVHHTAAINRASHRINASVYEMSKRYLEAKKFVAVVGGDHSSPYGLIKALSEKHKDFGILHIDAHHDLRAEYEGYEHSHASIMYNALRDFSAISKLVAVGIRDFSVEEYEYTKAHPKRVTTFYDRHIGERLLSGEPFAKIADEIVSALPKLVYVSFDIDGLDPALCPGTGTPVPGGLQFNQVALLLAKLVKAGKTVIGFDLCEVAPQPGDKEWNANVGARVLYKLCGALAASNRLEGTD